MQISSPKDRAGFKILLTKHYKVHHQENEEELGHLCQ